MKLSFFYLLACQTLFLLNLVTFLDEANGQQLTNDLDRRWEAYKRTYGKIYGTKTDPVRRKNWELALQQIEKHSELLSTGAVNFQLKETRFADYSKKELASLTGTFVPYGAELQRLQSKATLFVSNLSKQDVPNSIDLRSSPCMPPIKNQGSCGSCWAFSVTTPLEYQQCLSTGTIRPLSEQQLIDCTYDKVYKNQGCSGGWYMYGWDYLNTSGLVPSSTYSYTATDNNACKYRPSDAIVGVKSYTFIAKDEVSMQKAIATVGPFNAAICADCPSFYLYSGGVYHDTVCSGNCSIDHACTLVGYGKIGGLPVWILRNSWGPDWGINGYAFIARNTNQNRITSMPAFPTIKKHNS